MAPPSGCFAHIAFLQMLKTSRLAAKSLAPPKARRLPRRPLSRRSQKRQRAMSFNWTGKTSPDPARNILSDVWNMSRGILKITQINAQKGE
jgi:hypothetical protein